MNSQRWQKIKGMFDAALEIDWPKRGEFLDNACAGDADLRNDVQKLINSFDDADGFMDKPAANEVASLILEPKETLKNGQRFAHYEILSLIGTGGMGEVFILPKIRNSTAASPSKFSTKNSAGTNQTFNVLFGKPRQHRH